MGDTHQTLEGADIFASDMQLPEVTSKIVESFENSTVLVTGGTGFIGKLFLEKLLRVCKTVKVLILVRPKKGKDTLKRFQEIFEGPNMVPLELANPKFVEQIRLISGDCAQENLGLSEEDKQTLINEVNFVIHCAATVRFDEELKLATHINVRAVRDLLQVAKKMRNLKAFLHVSTAYSHCYRKEIDEKFYEPGMEADDLLRLVEALDQKKLTAITPELIKDWPNTYTFTKAIAEDLVRKEASRLPIAILRPSIVISAKDEPLAGWIDNLYGITGVMLGGGLGFIKVFHGQVGTVGDMIPVDYVVNSGLAVLWDLANTRSSMDNIEFPEEPEGEIPIYNVVSSPESPINWGQLRDFGRKEAMKIPSELQIWYPIFIFVSNLYVYRILALLLQTIPAYLTDGVCYCLGKEQRMVMAYQKLYKALAVINYFSLNEWKFINNNTKALWRKLEAEDRRMFQFSMKNFDWRSYCYFYVRGCRVYLAKDPLETLPKGRAKMRWLIILHYISVAILVLLGVALLNYTLNFFL